MFISLFVSNLVLILTKLPILSSLRMELNLGRPNLHVRGGGDVLSPAKKSVGDPPIPATAGSDDGRISSGNKCPAHARWYERIVKNFQNFHFYRCLRKIVERCEHSRYAGKASSTPVDLCGTAVPSPGIDGFGYSGSSLPA